MATQVEVKSMDVGRAGGLGGRLHLSPLADSSNKNPVEGSGPGSLILSPESAKPVPGPKPRLTPKPYMSEKTATVRPILAPKPNTTTRVDLAQPGSLKSDLPSTPKPSASLANYPAPATMTPTPKPGLTQTPRLHVLSRPTSISAEVGPQGADFRQPKAKAPTSAEWSGTTERGQALEKPGSRERPIVRAKSMGYLSHLERDSAKDQVTEDSSAKGVTSVRSGTWKNLKPRPISAILLPAEAQAETIAPDPSPRWKGRRPLSTDLTAKFEFVGLSLHRRPSRTDAKENTPERVSEDNSMPSGRGECEKGAESVTSSVPEHRPKPSLPERKNEKEDIREEVRTSDGIKRRITLLFDSALPAPAAESLPAGEPRTPTQSAVNANTPMGVKQRIQKLTEDSPSTPAPTPRMLFKPRPLPPDLTKRFAVEKSEELSCSPPSPQGREMPKPCSGSDGKLDDPASTNPMEGEEGEDRFPNPSDRLLQERQELSAEGTKGGSQTESRIVPGIPGTVVQTVRAALFENVVERHSVRVLEDPTFAARPRRSLSLRYGDEQARAHNSLRVDHMFDTVPAVGERRATSERVSIAQLEEKAMTLRSRRGGATESLLKPTTSEEIQGPSLSLGPKTEPRVLRVGALQKWLTETDREMLGGKEKVTERQRQIEKEKERLRQIEQEKERLRQIEQEKERLRQIEQERQRQIELERQIEQEKERKKQIEQEKERLRQIEQEKERLRQIEQEKERQIEQEKERQIEQEKERKRQIELEKERLQEIERQKEQQWKKMPETEREDVGAPKRLKMLEAEEQSCRPRATYFALTGQIQDPITQGDSENSKAAGTELPFDDFSTGSGRWGSQHKVTSLRRNPSLDAAFRGGWAAGWTEDSESEALASCGEVAWEMEREAERPSQKESMGVAQAELDRPRQKLLELQRHIKEEQERQRHREADVDLEKQQEQRVELSRQKEKQRLQELDKQRLVQLEKLEKGWEKERMRVLAMQQEVAKGRGEAASLRPQVLDLDTMSPPYRHCAGSPSGSRKQPSSDPDGLYHVAVLDIDSFRGQTQSALIVDIQGVNSAPRPQPTMPRQPGVPAVTTGESEPPRTQFQIEFLGQAEKTSLVEGAPTSSPMSHSKTPSSLLARVPSAKMAPKLSLEHLLQRHTERFSGSGRASQERRWSTMFEDSRTPEAAPLDNCNSSPSWEASTARVPDPHKPGRLTHTTSEHSRVPTEKGVEQGGVQRKQDSPAKDALRMRSRSVSRRSAPVESSPEGPLSRMRSRSAHRERGQHTWEQLKRCTSGEESRDTTTLVREADSQYGTWETGLHTEDSLTPATPTSESTASPSPRKPTPPHTPSELNATAAAVASPQGEAEPLTFPEASTTLLDSSALRSRVQLSKRRSRRTLPSRAARHSATLSMVQEGASDLSRDWMYRDSTEEKAERSKQADSAAEEPLRPTVSCTPSSQPHRAALFPGMDPSALKVQLKKRGDPDNQTDGPTPAPSQLSRSPKSPFLPRASRVLPPAGGKDNEEESSPQWLKELKSKKRFSQYENEA